MEKRNQARVSRETIIGLDVLVVPADTPAVRGRLLDMSATGAGVAVPLEEQPDLEDGERVVLVIGSHQLNPPITASATVRYCYAEGEQTQVGFRFVDPESLMAHVSDSFRRLFNARRAPRVQPEPHEPIAVSVGGVPEQGTAPNLVDAAIYDISATGLSLEVSADADLPVEPGATLCLVVRVPGCDADLPLTGLVRDRVPLGDRWRIGLELDPSSTPDFEERQAPIRAYVERRRETGGGTAT